MDIYWLTTRRHAGQSGDSGHQETPTQAQGCGADDGLPP